MNLSTVSSSQGQGYGSGYGYGNGNGYGTGPQLAQANMATGGSTSTSNSSPAAGQGGGHGPSNTSSSTSSSVASHQYAHLIQTINELRTDLERAIGKIKHLEKENSKTQSNYGKIKDELLETRKKYNEARENYHRAVAEKFDAERMNEEFMERVKIQLTDKTKEFEALREKFAPQDIDFIRIKLQEELEIPHKHRVQTMENEVESMRQQYFALRRELERSRAEFDAYSSNQKVEATTLINEKEEIISILRVELDKHKARENSLEKDDTIRSQRLRLQELSQTVDSVREELRTSSKERDSLNLMLIEMKSKTEELVGKYRARLAAAEADKVGAEQRSALLAQEIDRKDAANHLLREKLEDITVQHESCMSKAAEAESRVVELRAELAESILSNKITHTKEIQDLHAEIDRLNSRLADREELLRRAQREVTDIQTRFEAMNSEQRRGHSQQVQELNSRIQSLLKDCDERDKTQAMKEIKNHQDYENLAIETETLRAELLPLRKEKDLLHVRILELESQLETERRQNVQARRDSSSTNFTLQQTINTANEKIRELENQIRKLKQLESEKNNEVKQLKLQVDHSVAESTKLANQIRHEAQEKISSAEAKYQLKVEETKQSFNSLLLRERKKSQAYKERAIDAHKREKMVSETALAAAMYGISDSPASLYPSFQEVFGESWDPNLILQSAGIAPASSVLSTAAITSQQQRNSSSKQ